MLIHDPNCKGFHTDSQRNGTPRARDRSDPKPQNREAKLVVPRLLWAVDLDGPTNKGLAMVMGKSTQP